jgi:hypothetical protein
MIEAGKCYKDITPMGHEYLKTIEPGKDFTGYCKRQDRSCVERVVFWPDGAPMLYMYSDFYNDSGIINRMEEIPLSEFNQRKREFGEKLIKQAEGM